jgi:hypothetical protein
MIRIWAKVLKNNKIVNQYVFERAESMDYSEFFNYLREICENGDFFIMESFGLFDLLKSLSLFNPHSPTKNEEKSTHNSPEVSPANSSVPKNEEVLSNPTPTKVETSPYETPPSNACLEFINRHDELSRRRKRK